MADEQVAETPQATEAAPAASPARGKYASHRTADGFEVEGNTETAEAMAENLEQATEKDPLDPALTPEQEEAKRVKDAASKLGKRGADAKKEKGDDEKPKDPPKVEKKGNPRYDPKARVEEATREAAQLKRDLAQARREKEEARRELEEARRPKPNGKVASDDGAPDPNSYEDTPEGTRQFIRDEAAWSALQALKREREAAREREHAARTTTERTEREETRKAHWDKHFANFFELRQQALAEDPAFLETLPERIAGLNPTYALYLEAKERNPGREISFESVLTPESAIADEIIRSEHAPALMRYFAAHEDEFQRIAALRAPRDIVREVAIIEAGLDAAPVVPAKRTHQPSRAPAPIRPVQSSPASADPNALSDDLSDDEYLSRAMRARRTG